MKILVVCSTLLAAAVAMMPQIKSWGLPELEDLIISSDNSIDPNLLQCLSVAYQFYLSGMKDSKDPDNMPTIEEEDLKALIPSPSGKDIWTVDDLKAAGSIIVENLSLDDQYHQKGHMYTSATLQGIRDALELLTPSTGKVKTTHELVNMFILNTLHKIMSDNVESKKSIKKGYKVEIPMIDVSIWESDELHRSLKSPETSSKLIPYLKQALLDPRHFLDDGETFCVVTPVNVLPMDSKDYFIPRDTRRLLNKIKYYLMKKLW